MLSVTNVIFPEMSRLSTGGRQEELGALIGSSLRGMLFLLLPMTAGLMLLAEPLVRLLYEWRNWDSFSTAVTARALIFMSIGMAGYGIQNVLVRAFYARQDGRTPLISGAAAVVLNLALCFALTDRLDVAGLGIATAASTWASALVLLVPTIRRCPETLNRAFFLEIGKMLLAAAVMSLAVRGAAMLLPQAWTGSLSGRVLSFGIPAAAGAAVYFLAASLLRLREMETVKGLLRRK